MKSTLALAGLVAFAAGTPRPLQVDEYSSSALDKRSYLCADGQVTELKDYIVTNERSDVEGSQCTTVQGQGPDFAHWYTEWSWSGSKSVQKTFASAETRRKGNIPISKFGKMPTIWDWSYENTKKVDATVAYEVIGSSTCDETQDVSIQVWLGTFGGVKPVGKHIDNAEVNGTDYKVYKGASNDVKTYTFVSKKAQASFRGDLLDFITSYETKGYDVKPEWCVYSTKGGTQAYSGQGVTFRAANYSLTWDIPGSVPTTTPPLNDGRCTLRWGQCGGQGWTGPTCCQTNDFCVYLNDYHSQCLAVEYV